MHFHTNPSVLDLSLIWSPQNLLPRASLCWQLVQSSMGYKSGGKVFIILQWTVSLLIYLLFIFIKLRSPPYGRRTVILHIKVFWF